MLLEKINSDLIAIMKDREPSRKIENQAKILTLRTLLAEIKSFQVNNRRDPGDEEMQPLPAPRTPPKSAKKTASGLTFTVLRPGGKEPQTPIASDIVGINYAAYTEDGRLFDSSYLRSNSLRGINFDAVVPALLIPGLAEGIPLMRAGEKRRFWIPEKLAYGPGAGGRGLPAGNLIVDVEVGGFE